jgi:cytidylate kinase
VTAAPSSFIIVAIDGGAASGKSTSSKALAERFDLLHVDTGSFDRAVTAEFLRLGIPSSDLAHVLATAQTLRFGTSVNGRSAQMEIGGRVVPEAEIRSKVVNENVSHFAAIPEVRTALLAYQRGLAEVARGRGFRGVVMEGRDIGSVIFPAADFRFFLHADPAERIRRRERKGTTTPSPSATASTRRARPPRSACPAGATSIDTTHLTPAQVIDVLAAPVAARFAQP